MAARPARRTFLITVKSLKAQNDELVTAAKSLLDSKSTLNPVPVRDTNLCTYVENYLSRNNLDGITVTVKDPARSIIRWMWRRRPASRPTARSPIFQCGPATLGIAAHFCPRLRRGTDATRGESSADITAMVILNWDLDTVRDYLERRRPPLRSIPSAIRMQAKRRLSPTCSSAAYRCLSVRHVRLDIRFQADLHRGQHGGRSP